MPCSGCSAGSRVVTSCIVSRRWAASLSILGRAVLAATVGRASIAARWAAGAAAAAGSAARAVPTAGRAVGVAAALMCTSGVGPSRFSVKNDLRLVWKAGKGWPRRVCPFTALVQEQASLIFSLTAAATTHLGRMVVEGAMMVATLPCFCYLGHCGVLAVCGLPPLTHCSCVWEVLLPGLGPAAADTASDLAAALLHVKGDVASWRKIFKLLLSSLSSMPLKAPTKLSYDPGTSPLSLLQKVGPCAC